MSDNKTSAPVVPKKFLASRLSCTTSAFALWGFANDVTNPLVAVFRGCVCHRIHAQSTLGADGFLRGLRQHGSSRCHLHHVNSLTSRVLLLGLSLVCARSFARHSCSVRGKL